MNYKLYDAKGALVVMQDLQDKAPWCKMGESSENVFIQRHGTRLGLVINPEKKDNKYAADLKNLKTGNYGDLKTQHTPFFQAAGLYSMDPQFVVTFNQKDYLRYVKYYPGIEVYFWVDWLVTRFEGRRTIEVAPISGVWKIHLGDVARLVAASPLHAYQQRVNDVKGNGRDSYLFDLRNPFFEKVA